MKKLLNPRAVIFDMDGVIVDSMPYHFLAWYEALRPYGVRVSCFDVYAKEGERWSKSLKDFLKKEGIVPTRQLLLEIFVFRQRIFKKYFKRFIPLENTPWLAAGLYHILQTRGLILRVSSLTGFIFKDAEPLLRRLKDHGYLLALVTGTPNYEVKRILPKKLYQIFDNIVAGNNAKKGKPHPEPYLKAAKMLKVKPRDCIVVENAPYGIESAKRAGMPCIAISTSLPKEFLKEADFVVSCLREIAKFIKV